MLTGTSGTLRGIGFVLVLAASGIPARAEVPEWVVNPPPGAVSSFMVGIGHSEVHGEAAMQQAVENGLRKIVESQGIQVEPSSFRYERMDSVLRIQSTLAYQTEALALGRFQIMEEFRQEVRGGGWQGYVLIAYPSASPRRPRSAALPLLQSLVAPGWGHRSLGERRTGARFLAVSGLVLAGAMGSVLVMDQFHGLALKARTAEAIGYHNNRSRLFGNMAVGFSISYGLWGAYSVVELAGSKYLWKYL